MSQDQFLMSQDQFLMSQDQFLMSQDQFLPMPQHPANHQLFHGVSIGELAVVQTALDDGADPNAKGFWDDGPVLMRAVWQGSPEIVQTLLSYGADPNGSTEHGTLLHAAIDRHHVDIAVMLVEAGAYVTWGNGDAAIVLESCTLVRMFLDRGVDINAADPNGATFLMSAAFVGCADIVGLLLERGAAVNAKTRNGWAALMSASARGHGEVVRLLIEAGADVNHGEKDGDTALKFALEGGHSAVAALLQAAGATR